MLIILYTVFPFYWAINSSLQTPQELFDVNWFPFSFNFGNYADVFEGQPFGRNILNSIFISVLTVALSLFLSVTAAYALGRVKFRGRAPLLLLILSVSMFPQVAVLGGMFELIRTLGLYNNAVRSLILSYMIFTLPFTVWVLTTFMRDLPKELEEAAIMSTGPRRGSPSPRCSCR